MTTNQVIDPNLHWDGWLWWRWSGTQWMDASIPLNVVARFAVPGSPPQMVRGWSSYTACRIGDRASRVLWASLVTFFWLRCVFVLFTGTSFNPPWLVVAVLIVLAACAFAALMYEPLLRRIVNRENSAGYTTLFGSQGQRPQQELSPYWQLDRTTGAVIRRPGIPVIDEMLWSNLTHQERDAFAAGQLPGNGIPATARNYSRCQALACAGHGFIERQIPCWS